MVKQEHTSGHGHVLITGGTGFIGSALVGRLLDSGSRVSVLTRNARRARDQFDGRVTAWEDLAAIGGDEAPDVIVNLAGKNLGDERWDDAVKRQLVASRVGTTRQVVNYIAGAEHRPRLLVSGSAVGYYGARGDEGLDEESRPGDEFQSELCKQWEAAALEAEQHGVRVCISRTGIVMGRGGGALAGLAPMFRLGAGAVAGSGRQWVSWVHMDDLLSMFEDFMADDSLAGPFNNTAPNPVTNRDFSRAIGRALNRPVLLKAPAFAMRLAYGEMAHLYLTGQRVLPARHQRRGFGFRYTDIDDAVGEALGEG